MRINIVRGGLGRQPAEAPTTANGAAAAVGGLAPQVAKDAGQGSVMKRVSRGCGRGLALSRCPPRRRQQQASSKKTAAPHPPAGAPCLLQRRWAVPPQPSVGAPRLLPSWRRRQQASSKAGVGHGATASRPSTSMPTTSGWAVCVRVVNRFFHLG